MNQRISDAFPIRSYPYRVYYADTDAGGVVYYAHYLRMFEQSRTLYLEDCGISIEELSERNHLLICRRAEIDYRNSARLGDRLDIATGIAELTRTYVTFSYAIRCRNRVGEDGQPLLISEGMTQMVYVRENEGRAIPMRIPQAIADALISRP